MTCEPDYIVMGMSAETFWGGVQGNAAFEQGVREMTGREVTTGATAAGEALKAFGAKRIGIVTPYQPVGDEQVVAYFTELGYDVAAITGLCSASATSIADETPETLRAAFLSVDGPDVDALIQCGTNLECIAVAAELEQELGKPVIAINLATMWHAFRVSGIEDKIAGHGSLMEIALMFNHVGHLSLVPAADDAQVEAILAGLLGLPGRIDGLVEAQVVRDAGLVDGNATLRFHMRFESEAAWRAYGQHPAHVAVVKRAHRSRALGLEGVRAVRRRGPPAPPPRCLSRPGDPSCRPARPTARRRRPGPRRARRPGRPGPGRRAWRSRR